MCLLETLFSLIQALSSMEKRALHIWEKGGNPLKMCYKLIG